MRVVTWNCRRASAQSEVWRYLLELAPDIALLQEISGIPVEVKNAYSSVQEHPIRKNGLPQRFTTTILVRGSVGQRIALNGPASWVDAELQRFAGNLVGVEIQPTQGPRVKVICVHSPAWPVDRRRLAGVDVTPVRLTENPDVWVADLLWAALSTTKPAPDDLWIIGGDFNLCETFDSWKGGPRGNREYLNRMTQLGMVDCLRLAKGALTPTFRHWTGKITAQIDYLFTTDALRLKPFACDTGSRERVFEKRLFEKRLSDHLPIVADFRV